MSVYLTSLPISRSHSGHANHALNIVTSRRDSPVLSVGCHKYLPGSKNNDVPRSISFAESKKNEDLTARTVDKKMVADFNSVLH